MSNKNQQKMRYSGREANVSEPYRLEVIIPAIANDVDDGHMSTESEAITTSVDQSVAKLLPANENDASNSSQTPKKTFQDARVSTEIENFDDYDEPHKKCIDPNHVTSPAEAFHGNESSAHVKMDNGLELNGMQTKAKDEIEDKTDQSTSEAPKSDIYEQMYGYVGKSLPKNISDFDDEPMPISNGG